MKDTPYPMQESNQSLIKAIFNILPLLFAFLLLVNISFADDCGGDVTCNCGDTVTSSYNMTGPLESCLGTALTINANDVILDCNGSTITYATSTSSTYGINMIGRIGVTVKNCNIVQGSNQASAYGINLASSSNYNILLNNTITTNGDTTNRDMAYGIRISNSNNNNLTNNSVNGLMTNGIILQTNSKNNILTNNTIVADSEKDAANGISLSGGSNNTLISNTITTNGYNVRGISLSSSSNNIFTDNSITMNDNSTPGYLLYSIYLTSSLNNIFMNNAITMNGDANGVQLSSSSNNTLINNTISTTPGNQQQGLLISGNAIVHFQNNITIDNMIDDWPVYYHTNTYGGCPASPVDTTGYSWVGIANCTGAEIIGDLSHSIDTVLLAFTNSSTVTGINASDSVYGFSISNSSNNIIANNIAGSNIYGIYISSGSNNTIADNIVNLNRNQGISLISSVNNILTGNTITKTSSQDQSGLYITGTTIAQYQNNITTDNTINDLPINYYDGLYRACPDNTIQNLGSGYSWFGLAGCKNITMTATNSLNHVLLAFTNGSTVTGVNISNSMNGFILSSSSSNTISNSIVTSNGQSKSGSGRGIYLFSSSSNNTLTNNTLTMNGDSDFGIDINSGSNNNITSSRITMPNSVYNCINIASNLNTTIANNTVMVGNVNGWGIFLYSSSNGTIMNNVVTSLQGNAINLQQSLNNWIYNNFFNGSSSPVYVDDANFWNTTLDCGTTNIIGGPCTGGNFWAQPDGFGFSDNCSVNGTSNSSGICTVLYDINGDMNNVDNYPLAYPPPVVPDICGTLDQPNHTYTMTQNVSSAGTCFTIGADSITLDCNGFSITYAQTEAGHGVLTYSPESTIKNCIFFQYSSVGVGYQGSIMIVSQVGGVSIEDNNFTTTGSPAIHSPAGATNLNIINNTMTLNSASGGVGAAIHIAVYPTYDSLISDNTISTFNANSPGIAIYQSGYNNIITNNRITTYNSGGNGIALVLGVNTTVAHNNVTTYGANLSMIRVDRGSSNNVSFNLLTCFGDSGTAGVAALRSTNNATNNTFSDNIVIINCTNPAGGAAAALRVGESANNNRYIRNNVTLNSPVNFGIRVGTGPVVSHNNTFDGNIIVINNSEAVGVRLTNGSASNILLNNTLNITVSSATYIFTDGTSADNNMTNTTFAAGNGSVKYPQLIQLPISTDVTSSRLNISHNRIYLNSSDGNVSFLNVSAELKFLGLNATTHVATYDPEDDGTFVDCPGSVCAVVSDSGGIFAYNVARFTTYAAREPSDPPPTVAITSPLNGASLTSRTITISGTATDTNLNYTNISIKQGSTVMNSTTTASASFSVSLSVTADGAYTITATAYDLGGNNASSSVSVTVSIPATQQTVYSSSPSCSPNWICGNWSGCSFLGSQSRTCNDTKGCGTLAGKPLESRICILATAVCEPNWQCGEWTECSTDGFQARSCSDLNECRGSDSRPSGSRKCIYIPSGIISEDPTDKRMITGISGGVNSALQAIQEGDFRAAETSFANAMSDVNILIRTAPNENNTKLAELVLSKALDASSELISIGQTSSAVNILSNVSSSVGMLAAADSSMANQIAQKVFQSSAVLIDRGNLDDSSIILNSLIGTIRKMLAQGFALTDEIEMAGLDPNSILRLPELGISVSGMTSTDSMLDDAERLILDAGAAQSDESKMALLRNASSILEQSFKDIPEVTRIRHESKEDITNSELFSQLVSSISADSASSLQSFSEYIQTGALKVGKEMSVYSVSNAENTDEVFNMTLVKLYINSPMQLNNVTVIEYIPKGVVSSASELTFSIQPTIIEDDPLISWSFGRMLIGESKTITYVIKGKADSLSTLAVAAGEVQIAPVITTPEYVEPVYPERTEQLRIAVAAIVSLLIIMAFLFGKGIIKSPFAKKEEPKQGDLPEFIAKREES